MTALGIAVGGLIVSAPINRSVIGLPIILVLGAALTFLAIARPQLEGGVGERTVVVASPTESSRSERLGVGRLTVDLRSEQATTYRLDASGGLGRLEVIVPADATLRLHSKVGAGAVQLDDRTLIDGVRFVDQRDVLPKTTATSRTIDLSLNVGGGAVDVSRAG